MEHRLQKIYKQASDELQAEANKYFESFAERYEQEYNAYLQGYYTEDEFRQWYYNQVGRGERWNVLKTDMANRMVNANQLATAYINGELPWVYRLNSNFTAYEIEKGTGVAFNLVSEEAVKRLFEGANHTEFRTLSVNPIRDYAWNFEKIQQALQAGILQGNSVYKIADRFLEVMGRNKNASIRNARTALTSAQNGGKQSRFEEAKRMGIYLQKEWRSAHDGRVRDSHAELDGVRVEVEETFPNGCRYPADPSGHPREVYNCRCTMRYINPKYHSEQRYSITKGHEGYHTKETYKQWEERKRLADSLKSGNIELGLTKKETVDIPSMDAERFERIKQGLARQGIVVIQDKDGDAYLRHTGAEAVTMEAGKVIIFQSGKVPSASAVFEEVIHTAQLRGRNISTEDNGIFRVKIEIEANEKLLRNRVAYGLTEADIKSVEHNLAKYYKELEEYNKNV